MMKYISIISITLIYLFNVVILIYAWLYTTGLRLIFGYEEIINYIL